MTDYNYHTHTYRCGHASGEDEEYVLRAIADGYKVLGFSDHVMLPGLTQKGIRGDYSELEGYLESIRHLQEKYKDQITIYCGLECEYFEEFISYYKELLDSHKVDYLLLGQHFYFTKNGYGGIARKTYLTKVEGKVSRLSMKTESAYQKKRII